MNWSNIFSAFTNLWSVPEKKVHYTSQVLFATVPLNDLQIALDKIWTENPDNVLRLCILTQHHDSFNYLFEWVAAKDWTLLKSRVRWLIDSRKPSTLLATDTGIRLIAEQLQSELEELRKNETTRISKCVLSVPFSGRNENKFHVISKIMKHMNIESRSEFRNHVINPLRKKLLMQCADSEWTTLKNSALLPQELISIYVQEDPEEVSIAWTQMVQRAKSALHSTLFLVTHCGNNLISGMALLSAMCNDLHFNKKVMNQGKIITLPGMLKPFISNMVAFSCKTTVDSRNTWTIIEDSLQNLYTHTLDTQIHAVHLPQRLLMISLSPKSEEIPENTFQSLMEKYSRAHLEIPHVFIYYPNLTKFEFKTKGNVTQITGISKHIVRCLINLRDWTPEHFTDYLLNSEMM